MSDKKNQSYAEKNEERITKAIDRINEKGAEKKEEKKQEAEAEVYE